MKQLALVLFCKDEHPYLEEWLDYHSSIGVEWFFIYDNGSTPPIRPNRENVTVIRWDDNHWGRQCRAYAHCLKDYGLDFKWMGFIDTDEFIVPRTGKMLPEFLEDYKEFGGLAIYWLCFGSNGHTTKQKSVLESYTRRARAKYDGNIHYKCIVQPRFTCPIESDTPHLPVFSGGKYAVDETGLPLGGPHRSSLIQLNHYITRSKEDYEEKLKRGYGNRVGLAPNISFGFYDTICNDVEDTTILKVRNNGKNSPMA